MEYKITAVFCAIYPTDSHLQLSGIPVARCLPMVMRMMATMMRMMMMMMMMMTCPTKPGMDVIPAGHFEQEDAQLASGE